jgi:hypothetical protein
MTGLGMAVAGLAWLLWGVYLYRSSNVLERARRLPLGRSQFFRILLELTALAAFPEGLGFLVAGSAQALGASVVGLFAFIIGNLMVLPYGSCVPIGQSLAGCSHQPQSTPDRICPYLCR